MSDYFDHLFIAELFTVNGIFYICGLQQQQQQQQPFYGPLSGTTRVSRYQKKHSPTPHPDHHPIFSACIDLRLDLKDLTPELRLDRGNLRKC